MRILRLVTLCLLVCGGLSAQGIQFRVQNSGNVFTVANAGTVVLPVSALGQTSEITVSAFYSGAKAAAILRTELLGTKDFVLGSTATPTLQPTETYTFSVRYTASTTASTQALLIVTFRETGGDIATASFGISGTAPQVVATYSLPTDGNARPVATGGQIQLPAVSVNASAVATITLNNTGSAAATVRRVTVTGALELLNLPLLPLVVDPARSVSFGLRMQSSSPGALSGTVQVDGPGDSLLFTVSGSAYSPQLTYSLVSDAGTTTALAANSTVQYPATLVGRQAGLLIRVANQTPSPYSISDISLSDSTNFQLPTLPVFPFVLASGATFDVPVNFVPSKGDIFSSRLRIGTDALLLSGAGLSSALEVSVVGAQGETKIATNGTIPIPITALGTTGAAQVVIRNLTAGTISLSSAGLANDRSVFSLAGLPKFPLVLDPQQESRFTVLFAPVTTGPFSGSLAFDSYSYTISASATVPSKLPTLAIGGAPASITPLQQVPLTVTIDSPWPVDLAGDLTLSFDSPAFTADPSVQFSTGGSKVSFKIPAGTLKAVFNSGSSLVRIQTGSVAGEIQVSPTLRTAAGYDLTPSLPNILHLVVPPLAPTLFTVNLVASGGAYLVQMTGVSTTRSMARAHVKFAPTGRIPFSTTDFTVDLTAVANAWFRSSASNSFGGLFTVSIPVVLTVPTSLVSTSLTVADIFKSVTVDVENAVGQSAALTYTLPY